jgi:signal transduction histidine kinase
MEGTAYHDLALEYRALGDYEQALAYLAKAQVLFTRTDDPVGDVFVFFNQADTYLRMENYVQAEASAQAGLAAAQANGYHYGQILSLMTLGDISQAAQQLTKAFYYYEQALTLAQQSNIYDLEGSMQEKLGEVSLKQGDHSAALRFAQAALATYENVHSDLLFLGAQRLLAKIYKAHGDYAQALTALEAVQALSERVFNADNERRMRALIVLHRTEAARREAELLREKNAALEHEIAERKRTEQALIQAQKMESLGVLAGGVAHDFNNLLTSMVGQSSLALRKLTGEDGARPHIEKALYAMQRAADLVRQMLAYSGKGRFTISLCDLNAIIGENLPLLDSVTQNTLKFQLDLAPALPALEADQAQICQILANLILNAYEAEAKQVQIRTFTKPITASDQHYWQYTSQPLPSGNYVGLQVVDNGHGMSELTLQKLFDPFYTTKFTGRGLGLAAVLGIVRGHNGGITVESQPTLGTTITILLPYRG